MAMTSGMRSYVVEAKQRLLEGRQILQQQHDDLLQQLRDSSGDGIGEGRRIVSGMSDLADSILMDVFRSITADLGDAAEVENDVAIVLHGGSGRREMAPFSDVDLMLLCRHSLGTQIPELASRLAQDIFDIGFQLGQSVRTPREAWSMALKDPEVFSSLTESRIIGGNLDLHSHFFSRLQRMATRNTTAFIRSIVKARQAERTQFGETVYVLRPNVKKSRGGMRDFHLIRWLGFAKYGETDIDQLCRKNALTSQDASRINKAYDFLLRIRNDMHFQAKRANDELNKSEQLRIAEKFGYLGRQGVLPVEEFMKDYFDHTTTIRHICDQFVASMMVRRSITTVLAPLVTKQIDQVFQVTPYHVGISSLAINQVKTDFETILRLMQISNTHGKDIEQETWESIRSAMIEAPSLPLSSEAANLFVSMFSDSKNIGRTIRKLHEMRVLEKLLPEVEHARNLMQFNEYHQYTVDEHSIRAVEVATSFQKNTTPLGKIYRSLREKHLLNLALLIHDLGKGFPEDHCEVGRRFAESIGQRLQMEQEEIEDLKYLVHNHLMMSHTAFRRDINDENLVAEFAANVGSVKVLKLLYLLTCADVSAVGPGTMNQWKQDLLTDLYFNAKNVLTGHHGLDGVDQHLETIIQQIGDTTDDPDVRRWILQQARNLPRNYCRQIPPQMISEQLLAIRDTIGDEVQCWVVPSEDNLLDICMGKREKRRSGIFYKITGMLASQGLRILTADIKHLSNSLVWYWFRVRDLDNDESTPPRIEDIRESARRIATGSKPEPTSFRRYWRKEGMIANPRQHIRVQLDNQTVQTATVIDVFAFRKLGLLYTISKELFNLGLDVRFARMSTYGDRIVDVFYVTDDQGNKIRDRKRLDEIKHRLLETTRQYLEMPLDAEQSS